MRQTTRITALALCVACLCTTLLASCDNEAPSDDLANAYFNRFELVIASPETGTGLNERALEQGLVEGISNAKIQIVAAFENFESEVVANALVAAHERGIRVRFVGDIDKGDQRGIQILQDAGVDVVLGDGALTYSPEPTVSVSRSGSDNLMSHNFVAIDERLVYSLSSGFTGTNIHQLGFRAVSEDLGKDFTDEFNQMHAGVFATTLSAFNGPIKSITNNRHFYPTGEGVMQVHFGPQERITKRIIDEIYSARASVFIATPYLSNRYIADALRYKAMNGFLVAVIVDDEGTNVENTSYGALRADLDGIRDGDDTLPAVRSGPSLGQTLVLIDSARSPINGQRYTARAYMLSQPLLAALSFEDGPRTEARPADAFTDSHMWTLTRHPDGPNEVEARNMNQLVDHFETVFNSGR